jgi:D-proline reductase (dithiol) PrdB
LDINRTHRSFVSYIDKGRNYYEAQGYERPHEWAHFDEVPFARLDKPLSDCRVGVVTTANKAAMRGPRSTKLFAALNRESGHLHTDMAWDRDATHTDDPETYLPVARLSECVERGTIGSISERFYGAPTDYSKRTTLQDDAPQIEAWMREDGVDVALLVPI